ncbi:MAG: hypothetical protein BWK79_03055 [Beggiatoa sp. IS2]|nr:MAG: hypothetical protein BWK79_03055 [Beggiatoa sp. IS2]
MTTISAQETIKRQIGSMLVFMKLAIRRIQKSRSTLYDALEPLKAEKALLEETTNSESKRFLTHKLVKVTETIANIEAEEQRLVDELADIGSFLIKVMNLYDQYATLHDKAQILNVHHSLIERIEVIDDMEKSLFNLVFLYHGETAGENETFIGERGTRDCPFFDAIHRAFVKELRENRAFRKETNKFFNDVFSDLPRYRTFVDADGNQHMERLPPILKVVEPDGSKRIPANYKDDMDF